MKVSIVIPVFNQVKYVGQAIESVINQKGCDFECIVVDGGSTDGTVGVLKKYDGKIIWKSEKDNGLSNAVNKGLKQATGDIIAFIGSDDYYVGGALSKIEKYFELHPECRCVNANYSIVGVEGEKIQSFVVLYKKILKSLPFQRFFLGLTNFIIQPATFWRKELMDKIGLLDESLKYCMDYDYWLRMSTVTKISMIDECVVNYRIHPNSNRGSSYKKLFLEDIIVVSKYYKNIILLTLHKLHNLLIVFVYDRI